MFIRNITDIGGKTVMGNTTAADERMMDRLERMTENERLL